MSTIDVHEMQRDPLAVLRRVEAGETVLVTRGERAVAEIKPVPVRAGEPRPFGLCAGEFTVPDDFDQPLRIEDIARDLGMSVSGFHHHFRALTAMSPLQFQKQIRLQEARRLMLSEDLDAASAGYRVGYGDASHFTREYKRLFGAPPVRDVERLLEAATESAGL